MLPTGSVRGTAKSQGSQEMGHYKSNVRDLEFNLFEVFNVQERLGKGVLAESDEDTARGVLAELNRLATGPLAESFVDADRNPPTYDPKTFSATLPESFKKAYHLMWDGDWGRVGLRDDLGGLGLPPTVQWSAAELMLGANPPLFMYMAGQNRAQVLHRNGTDEQKRWGELMIERGWRHDGADRARRGLRRGRGPYEGRPAG